MQDLSKYQLHRNILCIDQKSFYATVECVLRGLDPYTTALAVADPERGGGSVVLAVSPLLKKRGVPSRGRVADLPQDIDIILARPRMQSYMDYSAKVIQIYLEFVSEEDIYIYSIDEAFLDITNYIAYYQTTDYDLAKRIIDRVHKKLGLTATCGIGPNMLMAKLAMDIESKRHEEGIAKWEYRDIETKLWPVSPLSEMWGIGRRMQHHLNVLGLHTIGDIAAYNVQALKRRFGILGEELWYHTHGIDMSLIQDKNKLRTRSKSYGISQVLFRDYDGIEIQTIILEMIDEVTRRLRQTKKKARVIHLAIGYAKGYDDGFSRQIKLAQPTSNEKTIFNHCLELLNVYYEDEPIRRLSVAVSGLVDEGMYQYSIFEDADIIDKEHQLQLSVDKIKKKYGKNAVTRAVSEESHSTAKKRNKQIGGHHV